VARLKAISAVAALLCAAPAPADPIDRWSGQIAEASARFGIPSEWIRRVMRVESGGRATLRSDPIVSRAGAIGLMQLMPGTWREMRTMLGLAVDANDPRDNILAGAAYLRAMYDSFGYPGLFAAYNAGPRRYADHLASGRALPPETRAYVEAVARERRAPPVVTTRSPARLFALTRAGTVPAAGQMFVTLASGER
jgi:soluble lytic murein transglycosylase-like protein